MVSIPKLTKDLVERIERDKTLEQYRNKTSNRKTHVFSASVEGFKAKVYLGVSAQRGKNIRISNKQNTTIHNAVTDYVNKLYSIFSSGKSPTGKFTYSFIGGNSKEFKVRITGEGDMVSLLGRIRSDAGLLKVSNIIKNSFKDIAVSRNIAVDLSHMEGSTVADQFATAALARYESLGFTPKDKESYEKLKIAIKYDPSKALIAEVNVEDTFWFLNQSTTEEAYITSLLAKVTDGWAKDNVDEISRGKVAYTSRALLKVAQKAGMKVTNMPKEPQKGQKTSTKTIKHKKKSNPTFSIEQMAGNIPVMRMETTGAPQTQNWSLLIPQINRLLTDKIRRNMVAPRLVNRTGKFASSVEVTKVETTKSGYPVFHANYDRDPYQVFDRTLGASPWNTASRDPKSLINLSIREIMKGLARGRFYVSTPVIEVKT